MAPILSCPGPDDPPDPDHDSTPSGPNGHPGIVDLAELEGGEALGTYDVLFETGDLFEALARTSGMYGVFPNGHGKPATETEAAATGDGTGPPGPPDSPPDAGNSSDDHHNGGRGSDGRPRCEHGHLMLCTDDLTGWWGPPGPDAAHHLWWCATWCARTETDSDGNPVDPTEWVHRSQRCQITPNADSSVTALDGSRVTDPTVVTVRAEKHPAQPVRFVLTIAIGGVEHTVTLTAAEAQRLYGFHDQVMEGLTGHRMAA